MQYTIHALVSAFFVHVLVLSEGLYDVQVLFGVCEHVVWAVFQQVLYDRQGLC